MEILLATRNRDKIGEMKAILKGLPVTLLTLDDFPDMPVVDETGSSLEENALQKAKETAQRTGKVALADDSGLEVEALNGQPGVRSSRFAGEEASYQDNNEKLLHLLRAIPEERRKAQFRSVVAIRKPDGWQKMVEGICQGKIIQEMKGETGFGYDPLFVPEGYDETFAEMGSLAKNKISHRAKALVKARRLIEKEMGSKSKT